MTAKDEGLIGIVEVPKNQAQVILETGYLYMEMGEFQKSEDVFNGCASLLPRSEVPHLALGQLFLSQERYPQAVQSYQKAIELRPDSAEAHAFLGEAYMVQGQAAQAIPVLEKAQELDQSDPPSAAEMARSLLDAHEQGVFPG